MNQKSVLRRLLFLGAALALLLAATVAVLLFVQPVLDLTPLKGQFEGVLTTTVGSPVTLERVHVQIGFWLEIFLEGLTVAATEEGFATDLVTADAVTLRLALIPLLRNKVRLDRFSAEGLELHVHRDKSGGGNWPGWTPSRYRIEAVQGIELTDVLVLLEDEKGQRRHALEIERLEAGVSVDAPLRLRLEGWLDEASVSLLVEGGRLGALQKPEEWPLAAGLELADLQLDLDGTVAFIGKALDLKLVATLSAESSATLATLARIDLPEVGPIDLRAQLTGARQTYSLSPVSGSLAGTSIDGSLIFDLSRARPHLQGQLDIGALDLSPWLVSRPAGTLGTAAPGPRPEPPRAPLDPSGLAAFDADLKLTIESTTGAGRLAQDLRCELSLQQGLLDGSARLLLDGSPVEGMLTVDGTETPPGFSGELTAQGLDLLTLAPRVADEGTLVGRIGRAHLVARARGTTVADLLATLSLTATVGDSELTYSSDPDQPPVDVALRRLVAQQHEGSSLVLDTEGLVQGEPASLSASTANLEVLSTADPWPIELTARHGEATLELEGKVLLGDEDSNIDLRFTAKGPRIRPGGLLTPPHVGQALDLPWKLRGQYVSEARSERLRIEEARIGRTTLHGDLQRVSPEEGARLLANLDIDTFDPSEIFLLLNPVISFQAGESELQLDAPGLPSEVDFGNADIDLKIGRIFRHPEDITDLSASLQFRGGRMLSSPFSFRVADAPFRGTLGLDLKSETPGVSCDLEAAGVNLQLLFAEDPVPGLNLTTDHLRLGVMLRGSTLEEMLRRSRVSGIAEGTRGEFESTKSGRSFPFELYSARIEAPTGGALTVDADGVLKEIPLSLSFRFDQPQRTETGEPLYPFEATAHLGETEAQLGGMMSLPFEAGDSALDLMVSGASLADLSPVSGRELPALGPYRLSGRLTRHGDDTTISGLDLTLGETHLHGEASLSMTSEPPRLTAELASDRLRLADFMEPKPEDGVTDSQTALSDSPSADSESPDTGWGELITQENLSKLDVVVSLEIGELVAGEESLGSGKVAARLEDGRLVLNVSGAEIYGGSAKAHLEIGASEQGLEAEALVRIERLSYGPLLKVLNPESSAAGEASLDLDLEAAAPSPEELAGRANGHVALTDYPEGISSSFLDLWGGHFTNAFLSFLTPNRESKVNCSVSTFSVTEGKMTPEVFILDTTRMRAFGQGEIDLGERTFDLTLRPRPKTRGVISLATPAKLGGTFEDPTLSFSKSGTALTAVRLYYWFWFLWREMLRKPLPADGTDVCVDPPPRAFPPVVN